VVGTSGKGRFKRSVKLRVTPGCFRVRSAVVARLGCPKKNNVANQLVYGKVVRDVMKEFGWREHDIARYQQLVLAMVFIVSDQDQVAHDLMQLQPSLNPGNHS